MHGKNMLQAALFFLYLIFQKYFRIAELSVREGQVQEHHQGVLQAAAGRPAGGDDRAGVPGVRQVRIFCKIFHEIFPNIFFTIGIIVAGYLSQISASFS